MSEKHKSKFSDWQPIHGRTVQMLQPFVSTIPCSLLSDTQQELSDTPIKLLSRRGQSGKIFSPETSESHHGSSRRFKRNKEDRSSGRQNPEVLEEENRRLREELKDVQQQLSRQTLKSQEYTRRLRLKDLEGELDKLELTSNKKDSTAKLTRQVHTLKVANHELTAKNDQITRSLASCRQLLAQADNKLRRKKELIKSKDEQLRRYIALVDELRAEYKPPAKEREKERDKDAFRKHQREHSNSNLRHLHNSNGQINSNTNRNESSLGTAQFSNSGKQLTTRQQATTKPMLKSLAPAGQLSRLWSGTIAKTTRHTSRVK